MSILFFDTESTGLIDFRNDLMHHSQPRIVQLAAILTEDDGTHLEQLNCYIKPDGWTIPEQATAIHGITLERCEAEGVPMPEVLGRFNAMKEKSKQRCAYNIDFDKRLLAREANIYAISHDSEGISSHCVMQMAKPICKMPPTERMMATGRKDFKPPKLEEAYRHFFGCEFDGKHDAMGDVIATIAVFFKIKEMERLAA